jgi:hypothetical protein
MLLTLRQLEQVYGSHDMSLTGHSSIQLIFNHETNLFKLIIKVHICLSTSISRCMGEWRSKSRH